MKYLLTLLLLVPLVGFSQTKGDTKIIVTPSDTVNLFNRVVSYLYEKGYSFERKDESAGFLLTDDREMKKYTALYKIRVLVKGGLVTFTTSLRVPPVDARFSDVWFTTGNSWNKITWNITDELAKGLGPVSYSK